MLPRLLETIKGFKITLRSTMTLEKIGN